MEEQRCKAVRSRRREESFVAVKTIKASYTSSITVLFVPSVQEIGGCRAEREKRVKIELETIPVWDGLNSDSECFICDLMKVAKEDALNYYLGAAIMVPEIRVEINRKGFCPTHFKALADKNKAQSLSLVLDTYMSESKGELYPLLDRIAEAGNARKAMKLFGSLGDYTKKREQGCLVCDYMNNRLIRYVRTVSALYRDDSEFAKALEKSKGFCLHHTIELAKAAPEELSGEQLKNFLHLLSTLSKDNLERCQRDDVYLSQKYKSENRGKPWNGCEDAHKRCVKKLFGEGRILSLH